jgi:hypothetical protein
MAKDPAFLFYDGDAARDVSHMNRLERGAYFDLIQAQRKFGGYTMEQARKILGKDFEACWGSLELILSIEGDEFYIEWVRNSILQRKEHAEKQRKRIQDYWDKQKQNGDIPRNYHGTSAVLPLEEEKENANEEVNNNSSLKEDFSEFVNTYHEACPTRPRVSSLNDTRIRQLKARIKQYGREKVLEAFLAVGKSQFLLNGNDNWAGVTFDWIIKSSNFLKIIEGNYTDKNSNTSSNGTEASKCRFSAADFQ